MEVGAQREKSGSNEVRKVAKSKAGFLEAREEGRGRRKQYKDKVVKSKEEGHNRHTLTSWLGLLSVADRTLLHQTGGVRRPCLQMPRGLTFCLGSIAANARRRLV